MIQPVITARPLEAEDPAARAAMERFEASSAIYYTGADGSLRNPTPAERLTAQVFEGLHGSVQRMPNAAGSLVIEHAVTLGEPGRFRYIQRALSVPVRGVVTVDSIYFGPEDEPRDGLVGLLSDDRGDVYGEGLVRNRSNSSGIRLADALTRRRLTSRLYLLASSLQLPVRSA